VLATGFPVLPLHPPKEDLDLWDAVQLIIDQLAEPIREALMSARGLTAAPIIWSVRDER